LAQAKAQREQAQLNLSYTVVTADQPGRVVQLAAAVGQYAQPGTNLTMFVPDDIWIWANLKETQLDHMRPGQPVTIDIDAYPERTIRGHLTSVQPGSGTAFSLLPAENATPTGSRSCSACPSRSSWTIRRPTSRSARACPPRSAYGSIRTRRSTGS
jgi:membrane fusion protein (multidrug efflux system)